jgi:hypothetical protein
MTAPAFGSLVGNYKKIAFSFAIPTIIFLGALYSSVTTRFIFFRLFANSEHRHSNTFVGWSAWVGIAAATWILAFVIAEVIPFFSDMLSLMSSLFDGWFGYVDLGLVVRIHVLTAAQIYLLGHGLPFAAPTSREVEGQAAQCRDDPQLPHHHLRLLHPYRRDIRKSFLPRLFRTSLPYATVLDLCQEYHHRLHWPKTVLVRE